MSACRHRAFDDLQRFNLLIIRPPLAQDAERS
jgi:hypothetical protein